MIAPLDIDVHAHFFPETSITSRDAGALRYLVGADRVMLGTDFCFDMGDERPLAVIQAKATGLGRKDQQGIVRDNAARMLHLG